MKQVMMVLIFFCLMLEGHFPVNAEETLEFGRFGKVMLYRTSPQPSHVVLFVSGDGGWNLGVIDMAQALAGLDALVVGIDITRYLKALAVSSEPCSYPAADFESLSKFVQKKLEFTRYVPPVLVGYSSGATLVYATLVQAPPNTFRGVISMGFCPDLPLSKPFCKGSGLTWKPGPKGKGFSFEPAPGLHNPWIAFQGTIDQVCDPGTVSEYVKKVGHAQIVVLPKVGHGFSVPRNWMPQFKQAFTGLVREDTAFQGASHEKLQDLPLVEVPSREEKGDIFAVILTGDGGWASLDRDVGETLAQQGIPVVGFNTLQYFWTPRTPDGASRDLARVLDHYLADWHKSRVLLIGYSLGADVLPFMADRLPPEQLSRVELVTLLGPGLRAAFEFHLSDWLGGGAEQSGRPVKPELSRLKGTRVLCIFGEEEKESLCRDLGPAPDWIKCIQMKGSHHFSGNYQELTDIILKELTPSR